jgi:hypothetical protein
MNTVARNHKAIFRVLDAKEAPHGGWFLKLRFEAGDVLTLRELKSATLVVASPDGATSFEVKVQGFPLFGGHPSDDRLHRTGRVDVHVTVSDGSRRSIGLQWKVLGPLR